MTKLTYNPKNIYEAFQPVFYVLKFLGLIPFSFGGPVKERMLKTSVFDGVWLTLPLCFHLFLLFLNTIYLEMVLHTMRSKILNYGWKICSIIGMCGGIFMMLYQVFFKKRIKMFLRVLYEFDQQVCFKTTSNKNQK